MADWVAAIAAGVAALFAGLALAVALRAKEIAESANGIAEDANDLAAEGNELAQNANETAAAALGEAGKANEVAEQANQLSGDANSIAERALYNAQDDLPYNWVLKVGDDGVAAVLNDCGHHARQVSIVLDSGSVVVTEAGPVDVAPFGEIELDAQSVLEEHFDEVRKNPVSYAHSEGGIFFAGSNGKPVSVTFRAHLRWRTEQDIPRTDVVHKVLRHHMTYDGLQRVKERRRKGATGD
jgi:hypothetical protein